MVEHVRSVQSEVILL